MTHSFIGHKEYRFVFPGFECLVIVSALTCADLCIRLLPTMRPIRYASLCAVVISAWLATSLYLGTGPAFRPAWKHDRLYVQAALQLSRREDICGLLMYKQPTPGYSFIHHDVPIYESQSNRIDLARRHDAIPAAIWGAFNFVIASREDVALLISSYHLDSCLGTGDRADPCILHRPGTCTRAGQLIPLLEQKNFGRMTDAARRSPPLTYLD